MNEYVCKSTGVSLDTLKIDLKVEMPLIIQFVKYNKHDSTYRFDRKTGRR